MSAALCTDRHTHLLQHFDQKWEAFRVHGLFKIYFQALWKPFAALSQSKIAAKYLPKRTK